MIGNRSIFRAAWSLARQGARRFGGRASVYFRSALGIVYADGVKVTSERPSARKSQNRIYHAMRFPLALAMVATLLIIAPVTHASIALVIGFMFPSYLCAQAALVIWKTTPAKAARITR